jgi:hypothetical protein
MATIVLREEGARGRDSDGTDVFSYIPGDLAVLVTRTSWIDYGNPTKAKQKQLPKQTLAWLGLTRQALITDAPSTERTLLACGLPRLIAATRVHLIRHG